MKYVHYNKSNKILGYYDKKIHKVIPTPNLEISNDNWKEAVEIGANIVKDGKLIKEDTRSEKQKKEASDKQKKAEIKALFKSIEVDEFKISDIPTLSTRVASAVRLSESAIDVLNINSVLVSLTIDETYSIIDRLISKEREVLNDNYNK